jgi:hypothetical protein
LPPGSGAAFPPSFARSGPIPPIAQDAQDPLSAGARQSGAVAPVVDLEFDGPPPPDVVETGETFPIWSIVVNRRSAAVEQLGRFAANPALAHVARQYEPCLRDAANVDRTIEDAITAFEQRRPNARPADVIVKMIEQALAFYESLQIKLDDIEAAST